MVQPGWNPMPPSPRLPARCEDETHTRHRWSLCLISVALACLAISSLWFAYFSYQHVVPQAESRPATHPVHKAKDRTLVMYIFADTDPEFRKNLMYFVCEAIRTDDNCDYVIVVQQTENGLAPQELPPLPTNAKYVFHKNECYDWGTFGWLLHSGYIRVQDYTYFIFMNCSVRGPYLPMYLQGKMHWTLPLLSRINDNVKLVGPTISCEGSPLQGNPELEWRRNPHVQSYVAATDKVGMKVLLDKTPVFQCHKGRWDAIYFSELGSSWAILTAGYNLDSLMLRYQGVDWRNKDNWNCNARSSPSNTGLLYDGISLDPLEVMFVKVKSFLLECRVPFAVQATKYQLWRQLATSTSRPDIKENTFLNFRPQQLAEQALLNEARGSACFDMGFYQHSNPDLATISRAELLWQHFLRFGQFEGRPHRFVCNINYDMLVNSFLTS